jgi:DNA-binding transcriptional MerR regulator
MSDFFTSTDVANNAGVSHALVQIWAAKNGVQCAGSGKGSIYLWTEADIERFKARDTKRGRRWHKD